MKTLILTLALAILATFTYAQFPQSLSPDSCCYVAENLRIAIYKDNDSFVNVKIAKIPGELVKIRVKENHNVLYLKRVKQYAVTDLKYDISQFPSGTYTFEIIKDKEVVYSTTVERENSMENLVQR